MAMERTNYSAHSAVIHPDASKKSDILEQLSRRPPRNGGLTKLNTLEDWAEFSSERKFEPIRKYLLEAVPTPVQENSKSGARKHFLEGLFRSRSDRRASKESRKALQMQSPEKERLLPVLAQRTSKGGRYGQIITNQVYDSHTNASTYKVNLSRGPSSTSVGNENWKRSTAKRKAKPSSSDVSSLMRVTGFKGFVHPVHRLSAHQSNSQDSPSHAMSSSQILESSESMAPSHADKSAVGTQKSVSITGNSVEHIPKLMIDAPLRPLHHTDGSFFGLSKEHAHLLVRDDRRSNSPRALQPSISNAESQPNIRDFASNDLATTQRSQAIRRSSRSPVERSDEQVSSTIGATDFPIFPTYNGQTPSFEASTARTRTPILTYPTSAPQIVPPMSDLKKSEPKKVFPPSTISGSPPKIPSKISAEMNPEEVYSNTSSIIVSNAHSAVVLSSRGAIHNRTCTPPQPGPAPTRALPSLPESHVSMTLQTCDESSHSSPEDLVPFKVLPKSPARYRFTPIDAHSPPRKYKEASLKDTHTEAGDVVSPPGTALIEMAMEKSRDVGIDRAEPLPKQKRTENIKAMTVTDMARRKTRKAAAEDDSPDTIAGANTDMVSEIESKEVRHEGLLSPTDMEDGSYTSSSQPARHHKSQYSQLSVSTTLLHQDSSTVPRPQSQNLSPIILVAEQRPTKQVSPILQRHSPKLLHRNGIVRNQRYSLASALIDSFRPFPYPLASSLLFPSLHILPHKETGSEIGIKPRPSSAQSMPQPSTTSRTMKPSRARPVNARSPSLLHQESLCPRCLQSERSSMIHIPNTEDAATDIELMLGELEARVEAVERKNLLLERALFGLESLLAAHEGHYGTADSRMRLSTASVP